MAKLIEMTYPNLMNQYPFHTFYTIILIIMLIKMYTFERSSLSLNS